jgi:hypothetical protein
MTSAGIAARSLNRSRGQAEPIGPRLNEWLEAAPCGHFTEPGRMVASPPFCGSIAAGDCCGRTVGRAIGDRRTKGHPSFPNVSSISARARTRRSSRLSARARSGRRPSRCARAGSGRGRDHQAGPIYLAVCGQGRGRPLIAGVRRCGIARDRGMAEGAGFEPARRFFTVYTLSRRAPSTARPPLHRGATIVRAPVGWRQ